jgi:ribosomal-protein-alanine acetyltransferase
VNIRFATPDDIPFMMALERMCPTAGHWTKQQYAQLFERGEDTTEHLVLIAEDVIVEKIIGENIAHGTENAAVRHTRLADSQRLGFLVARQVSPEWELENIVVAPAIQRRGLGRQLLEAFLNHAKQTDSESVFLEVRESNLSARLFYEKAGFQHHGNRKSYYANPLEDAILYSKSIS